MIPNDFAELERLHGPAIDHLSQWSRTELYRMARERVGRRCDRLTLRHGALRVWADQLRDFEKFIATGAID